MRLDVIRKIPYEVAKKYNVIAVHIDETGYLVVETDDLSNFYVQEELQHILGRKVRYVWKEKQEIARAIDLCYAELEVQDAKERIHEALSKAELFDGKETDDTFCPVVCLLNSLLVRGYRMHASDIHLEPEENELKVRMRIDGQLIPYIHLKKEVHLPIITRAKVISGMNITEKRLPQDGNCKVTIQNIELNLRVSTIPTVLGEKMVIRFLDMETEMDRKQTFGMDEETYQKLLTMLKRKNGLIYLTGPTGSGKTTTLYLILEELKREPVNVMTIEEPVEKQISGINQIQINEMAGLTFEMGLRAILRQDPDIIMVGETRDMQTAKTSVRAAITGHLVLSTLHTVDAVGVIARMHDMGIEPFFIADSLNGAVSQRLVRKICSHCKEKILLGERERNLLGQDTVFVYRGRGCSFCGGTGYKGRIAVHEIFMVDGKIKEMIVQKQSMDVIREYVRKTQAFYSLRENTIRLVKHGITTMEEAMRVIVDIE